MPCLSAPKLPKVGLPSPLSVSTPAIGVKANYDANLCCQILVPIDLSILPSLPLGPVINAAVLATLSEAEDALNAYLDKLQVSCPLDGPVTL